MKAIVKTVAEPGGLAWSDWPDPEARPGHVVVEIARAGICSTDVAIYDWTYRGRRPLEIPSMLGHEAAGTVVDAAPDVTDVAVGDRVALQVIWGRPHARESLLGFENLDPDWRHIGASALGGAFADRIAVPADRVFHLPPEVGWEEAAMIEPLAVAAHAMELVAVRPGERFALVGPGPFGLLMCQIAKAAGAARVVAVGLAGVDEARLEVAARIGADEVVAVEAGDEGAAAAALAAIGDSGADAVADAGGTPGSMPLALDLAAPAGRVAIFGFTRETTIEPLRQIIRKGLGLFGVSAAQRRHYALALRMIETRTVRPSKIVSHRLPMEQVADGIELVKARVASKVLLHPGP